MKRDDVNDALYWAKFYHAQGQTVLAIENLIEGVEHLRSEVQNILGQEVKKPSIWQRIATSIF